MRRRKGGIVLMVFGLLLAAVVGGAVYVLAQGAAGSQAQEMTTAVKVVALIPQRTVIPATALALVQVPADLKPATALTSVEQAVNKLTLSDLYPGDWVLSNRIADTTGQSGQSFTLDPGTVMMTFPGSDIIGTGVVRQGDSVDVIVTIDTSKENPTAAGPGAPSANAAPGGVTQITIQNLKVENIGAVANAAKDGPQPANSVAQLITFAVPREDAIALKQIKDYPGAKIEVVLRAAGDEQLYPVQATNMKRLIERFKIQVAP